MAIWLVSEDSKRETVRRLWKQGKNKKEIALRTGLSQDRVLHIIAGFKAHKTIRREQRKRSRSAFDAHFTRRKLWRAMKRSLLILDCTSLTREGKSEGALLDQLIDILNAKSQGPLVDKESCVACDRGSFIEALEGSDHGIIHISAHGGYSRSKGPFISLPSGSEIKVEELTYLWRDDIKSRLVFLSACETGQEELAKAFSLIGCRYFIAPKDPVCWYDAATFLTLFYRLLLVERNKSPWVAFKTANRIVKRVFPKFSGSWRYFEDGIEWFGR